MLGKAGAVIEFKRTRKIKTPDCAIGSVARVCVRASPLCDNSFITARMRKEPSQIIEVLDSIVLARFTVF